MSRFGRGYIVDTHDKSKDPPLQRLLGVRRAGPASYLLESHVEKVRQQSITSCCVGFSISMGVQIRCSVLGTPIPWPSPTNIYTSARALERRLAGLDPKTTPLLDNGSQPYLAIQGAHEFGVTSESIWEFNPGTINDEPTIDLLEAASVFKLNGYSRISSTGTERLRDIEHAISSGYPVCAGLMVDQAFEDYTGKGLVNTQDSNQYVGGHMLCCIGYSNGLYRWLNSWGEEWGDNGKFWASAGFMMQLEDIYAISVSSAVSS